MTRIFSEMCVSIKMHFSDLLKVFPFTLKSTSVVYDATYLSPLPANSRTWITKSDSLQHIKLSVGRRIVKDTMLTFTTAGWRPRRVATKWLTWLHSSSSTSALSYFCHLSQSRAWHKVMVIEKKWSTLKNVANSGRGRYWEEKAV